MDIFGQLLHGFSVATAPMNLLFCFIGVLIGTLIGVLPGIGPPAALSLLLPVTFHVPPVSAIILLAGIMYGAMYGGSTTSILVNIPGEAASVVTCLDGYQMAKKGRAGAALGISAFGSFIAGTISILLLVLLAPTLATFALRFGPPEYFSLMILGLSILVYLAKGSIVNALLMVCFGLLIGTVGLDPMSGVSRFTFKITSLMDGVGLVQIVIGLFGVSEVFLNVERAFKQEILKTRIKGLLPNRAEWKRSIGPIGRGTVIGFFLGVIPGMSVAIPTFISYTLEKKLSHRPDQFGTGMIEGVAGPESANNAASSGTLVPMLSLGIPTGPATALLLGALMIHGLRPGPLLITESPDVFWGLIASLYVGNAMLLVLNLPLIPLWVKILKIPYHYLFPLILLFCIIGAYAVNNNQYDILIMIVFGVIGYVMKKLDYEAAPLVLALVLGPIMENAVRRSLIIADGNPTVFFTRPLSAFFLIAGLLILFSPLFLKKKRVRAELRTGEE
ncbi:MAG: tripartite tricarboxylate transporter permease [Deltaproteobacteria bacterium]|nr:tripartite tricarboxylate transporter permease [Deltaproteobacteria bacterium]